MDLKSMAFMVGVGNLVLILVLLASYRWTRAYSGMGWWLAAQVCLVVGFAGGTLRNESIAGRLIATATAFLIIMSPGLFYIGTARFFGRRERRRAVYVVWLIFLVVWSALTFIWPSVHLRRGALFLSFALLLFAFAWELWRNRSQAVRRSARALAITDTLGGLMVLGLGVLEMAGADRTAGMSAPSRVMEIGYVIVLSFTMLMVFGLTLMVSERLANEVATEADNFAQILATSPGAMAISRLSDGRLVDGNLEFTSLTGYERDEYLNRTALELGLWQDPDERQKVVAELLEFGRCEDFLGVLVTKDGRTLDISLSARLLHLGQEPFMITLVRDVSEQRRREELLVAEATTDGLTGMANRRHLLKMTAEQLPLTSVDSPLTLGLVDLDRLKRLNDTHGHSAGDRALQAVAHACLRCARPNHTVGRLGGDEFAILMPDTSQGEAVVVMELVRSQLADAAAARGAPANQVTVSVGLATTVRADTPMDELIAAADKALYEAKAAGRDNIRIAQLNAALPTG